MNNQNQFFFNEIAKKHPNMVKLDSYDSLLATSLPKNQTIYFLAWVKSSGYKFKGYDYDTIETLCAVQINTPVIYGKTTCTYSFIEITNDNIWDFADDDFKNKWFKYTDFDWPLHNGEKLGHNTVRYNIKHEPVEYWYIPSSSFTPTNVIGRNGISDALLSNQLSRLVRQVKKDYAHIRVSDKDIKDTENNKKIQFNQPYRFIATKSTPKSLGAMVDVAEIHFIKQKNAEGEVFFSQTIVPINWKKTEKIKLKTQFVQNENYIVSASFLQWANDITLIPFRGSNQEKYLKISQIYQRAQERISRILYQRAQERLKKLSEYGQ